MNNEPHGEKGHLNICVKDQDSIVTNFGKHARVVAFHPDHEGLYIRVDRKWGLRDPSLSEILSVARKDQGIRGRWVFDRKEEWADGRSVDYWFSRA